MENAAKLTWWEEKYWGLLNAKIRREEMEIWPFFWHEKQSTSRLNYDILMNRLDLVHFPPFRCFFSRGWGDGKRHSYDWCRDGCQHKLDSFFPPSLLERLLHWKTHYTFTTSKSHSNFYYSHFRVSWAGKRQKTQLKQNLKTTKWGRCSFRNQSE